MDIFPPHYRSESGEMQPAPRDLWAALSSDPSGRALAICTGVDRASPRAWQPLGRTVGFSYNCPTTGQRIAVESPTEFIDPSINRSVRRGVGRQTSPPYSISEVHLGIIATFSRSLVAGFTKSRAFRSRDNPPGICGLRRTSNRARDGPYLDLKIQIADSRDVRGKR